MNKDIWDIHLKRLGNLNHHNKPLIIMFSGVPGSGKSTLVEQICSRFKAIKVSNDEIRAIIRQIDPAISPQDLQETLQKYVEFFIESFKTQSNQLLVLDSGIDRKYDRVKKAAGKDYGSFIIRMVVDKDELIRRIKTRPKSRDNHSNYLQELNRWWGEWEDFGSRVKADYTWDQANNSQPVGLFEQLDKLIR